MAMFTKRKTHTYYFLFVYVFMNFPFSPFFYYTIQFRARFLASVYAEETVDNLTIYVEILYICTYKFIKRTINHANL